MADFEVEDAAMPYSPGVQPETQVEIVLRQHQGSLLSRPGVTGVGIGRSAIGGPAVIVYLLDPGYSESIPKMLNGFPVILKVTGEIKALGS